MKMKRMFRRNQIIITTLAIMIAAAGYLNYSGKKEVMGTEVYEAGLMEISDEDILAENQALSLSETQLTDSSAVDYKEIASLDDPEEGNAAAAGSAGAGIELAEAQQAGMELAETEAAADGQATVQRSDVPTENPGEAVLTGGTSVTEYIASVQLNREQVRARSRETLNEIINNESVDAASREAAVKSMMELTAISEKENAAETLLMAKGFSDPVVSITDGKVDVVINAANITDPERAQIEDIVKRKTETSAENVVITLLNLEE